MANVRLDRVGRVLGRFGLYVLTGLVLFTVVRLALNEYGASGWHVTGVALLLTLLVLELLTRIGWLAASTVDETDETD